MGMSEWGVPMDIVVTEVLRLLLFRFTIILLPPQFDAFIFIESIFYATLKYWRRRTLNIAYTN
jgi:hypothetical protein